MRGHNYVIQRSVLAPSASTEHFRSILVPVDGSHASMQAVALACTVAKKNKGAVYVVHVIEVERSLPLTAEVESAEEEGDEFLTEAEKVAEEQGFEVEGAILHAREAGPVIVEEARERNADLIIMGTEYQQPFGEFQLGSVVQYVLKNAPCDVWVCRHHVEE